MNAISKTRIIVVASCLVALICLMPPRQFPNGSKAPRKLVGVTSVKKRSSYVRRSANGFEMGISLGASSIHVDAPRLLGELLFVGVVAGLGIATASNRKNKQEPALVSA